MQFAVHDNPIDRGEFIQQIDRFPAAMGGDDIEFGGFQYQLPSRNGLKGFGFGDQERRSRHDSADA